MIISLFEILHQLHIHAVLEYWKLRVISYSWNPFKPMRDYKFIQRERERRENVRGRESEKEVNENKDKPSIKQRQ